MMRPQLSSSASHRLGTFPAGEGFFVSYTSKMLNAKLRNTTQGVPYCTEPYRKNQPLPDMKQTENG